MDNKAVPVNQGLRSSEDKPVQSKAVFSLQSELSLWQSLKLSVAEGLSPLCYTALQSQSIHQG